MDDAPLEAWIEVLEAWKRIVSLSEKTRRQTYWNLAILVFTLAGGIANLYFAHKSVQIRKDFFETETRIDQKLKELKALKAQLPCFVQSYLRKN